MIKGINKQIIEITDMENIYYEKAILFLKPEYSNIEKKLLEKQAKNIFKKAGNPAVITKRKKVIQIRQKILIFSVAVLTLAVIFLIYRLS